MHSWISRAGALAPTMALLLTFVFAGDSAALAEDLAPPPAAAGAVAQDPPSPTFQPAQFYSEPVVQPLAGEPELERAFGPEAAARYAAAGSLQELVGDMPIEGEMSDDLECLAEAVYFEARGEPLNGQLAVARVVVNRAGSGLYPGDYCSVVTQRAQFSFVRNGRIPQPDESSAAWRKAKAVAQIAHQDLWESEAGDALFFHATYVKPGWARRKIQLARIDTHVFYR